MKHKQILAEVAGYLDAMDIHCDSAVQCDLDESTQTLRIHVLTQEELASLAGHCDDCLTEAGHSEGAAEWEEDW